MNTRTDKRGTGANPKTNPKSKDPKSDLIDRENTPRNSVNLQSPPSAKLITTQDG
jgi:hypothetical protein